MDADQQRHANRRGRKIEKTKPQGRSISLECPSSTHESPGGLAPNGISSTDVFIISRLGDTTSYFFSWFCKKYRIRIGALAGGSSPIDLSSRWRNLTKIPPRISSATDEVWGDTGSLDAACSRKRWLEATALDTVGHLEVGELSERLDRANGSQGSGALSAVFLQKSWMEAGGFDSSVGELNVCELSERLNGAIGSKGSGGLTAAGLRERWLEASGLDSSVGHVEVDQMRERLSHAIGSLGTGGLSPAGLRQCWLEANGFDSSVGDLNVCELSQRLNCAIGSQCSGGLSAFVLRKRWFEANGLDLSVGDSNVYELSERLNQAMVSQGVGAITGANLEKRWNADLRHKAVDNDYSNLKKAAGVGSSWCCASRSAPVG
eukprot:g3087.t1